MANTIDRLAWVSWIIRALLVVLAVAQWLGALPDSPLIALGALVVSLAPLAVGWLARVHVPWLADLPWVLAVTLITVTRIFNLSEQIRPWDKLVHFSELFLLSWLVLVLLLGYRDAFNPHLPWRLLAIGAILFGISLGTVWEMVEFSIDQFLRGNWVQSTLGTLLDLLFDTLGAVAGTLAAVWAYRRFSTSEQRRELGRLANWLAGQPPGADSASRSQRAA